MLWKIPKTFVTGATGYVGGDTIFALLSKHPEWESKLSVLVRNKHRGEIISKTYPKVRLVYGGLNDLEILVQESAAADIVLNFADSDHPPSAKAIVRGAKQHTKTPVFVIHTSGTGILTWKTVETGAFGQLEDKVYDDWEGVDEVTSLPDHAAHRNVDKIILDAGETKNESVKTAIVCPPSIYGIGRGPGNKRSQQLYNLTSIILQAGEGKRVGAGENQQTHIHIKDLSDLYVLLIEAAAAGGGAATWGKQGYYFSSRAEQSWGQMAELIAKAAFDQGFISSKNVSEFETGELAQSAGHSSAALIYGGNAREKSFRAAKLLGWSPSKGSIFDEIPLAVASEAKRLGLVSN